MNKALIILAFLLACTLCKTFEEMEVCLADKCPDKYAACKADPDCEPELRRCADNCGIKVNALCYTFCVKKAKKTV